MAPSDPSPVRDLESFLELLREMLERLRRGEPGPRCELTQEGRTGHLVGVCTPVEKTVREQPSSK